MKKPNNFLKACVPRQLKVDFCQIGNKLITIPRKIREIPHKNPLCISRVKNCRFCEIMHIFYEVNINWIIVIFPQMN